MNKWQRFFKIAKVDSDQQMVYGYASTSDLDSDGEVIKVDALAKALPEYLQFPTIREMHEPRAIGTTKEASVDKKGLYIGAKIVNKEAWNLVKEGVYKAFSIGGDVIKRVGNVIQELDLIEISLVDVPANKHATIEVWKRGKVSKDAETAYSMANLMIQVKDLISYYDFKGKDTKKLTNVLEMIKSLLITEAQEPEISNDDLFEGATVEELEGKINILKSINFGNNKVANLLREGVIMSMKIKAKKLKKVDDPKEEETTEETTESEDEETTTETSDEKAEEKTEKTEEEADDEEEAEEESEETSTEEAKGELATALKKIDSVNKTLEALNPSKVEKASKDVMKAVSSMAGSLAKVAETMVSLEGRIAKLEKTPAATKAKSAVVMKSINATGDETTETEEKPNSELAVKKARLAELGKIYNQIGKVEYAHKGYSQEAARLMGEIEVLEAKEANASQA